MTRIAYLLDENVDPLYQVELLKREPELVVWMIGTFGAPSQGTLDPEILHRCERNDFVLVTNNRYSMPVHLRDHLALAGHVPGIFVLNVNMSVGTTIEELLLIWGASEAEEYRDRISYLPISYS